MSEEAPDPRAEMESRGWEIVYKPHAEMAAYNAFYRVEYEGQEIAPPAARREGVPLNEVWLSEKFRPYERYILFHELSEIAYRAAGYGVEKAHELAEQADKRWAGDPKWEEFRREINVVPPELVTQLEGFDEALFERIQHNRPYCDMAELREVPGIDGERFRRLEDEFWCVDCDL